MAVPGPPVSLAAVRAEFGAPAGTPLSAFVRGGTWVPDIAQNAGVPTTPPIRLAQLAGAVKYQPMTISGPNPVTWIGPTTPKPPRKVYTSSQQTVTGGNPAKSYNWTYLSGGNDIMCDAPTTLNGSFWAYGAIEIGVDPPPETTSNAVWRLTVSDGTSSVSSDVTFSFTTGGPI